MNKCMKLTLLMFCVVAGCRQIEMPAYFWANQGEVRYVDNLANPLAVGFTDVDGTIYIKNRRLSDWVGSFWMSDNYILRHEQIHSFEYNIYNKNTSEYSRFHSDFDTPGKEYDIEDLPRAFFRKNPCVMRFIEGGYVTGE